MIIVLSSPSGCGKSTIARHISGMRNNIGLCISCTTRTKRNNEIDNVDYYFKSNAEFERMLKNDELLEHTKIYDHYYGTEHKTISSKIDLGMHALLDIDFLGYISIKNKHQNAVVGIYILPPSIEELALRLKKRGDDEKSIKKRMACFYNEIRYASNYDYIVVNNDLEETINTILKIIDSEMCKTSNRGGLVTQWCVGQASKK